jgi:hypothetical protein
MIKLTNLIKEAKTVKVPKFKTSKEVANFITKLPSNVKVADDVFDPETGEVYMEKGDTKAKLEKKKIKSLERLWDKWDRFHFFNDSHSRKKDFEEYFNVVYRDFGKGLSDEEKEMYFSGGYEWDFDYPSKIKRKDGKSFTQNDVENIENFADWYSKYVLSYGAKLQAYAQEGKKIAEIESMFV